MEDPLIRHTTHFLGVLISSIAIGAAEAKPKFVHQQAPTSLTRMAPLLEVDPPVVLEHFAVARRLYIFLDTSELI